MKNESCKRCMGHGMGIYSHIEKGACFECGALPASDIKLENRIHSVQKGPVSAHFEKISDNQVEVMVIDGDWRQKQITCIEDARALWKAYRKQGFERV